MGACIRLVGTLALVLTLDASIQEFTELISLSDEARRERFRLPATCTPIVSAVKPAAPNGSRLTVLVDCRGPLTLPSSPIRPAAWRNE
jgi:hypothetical protein